MKRTKLFKPKLINYTGPSMNPTLWAGDEIQVVPYDGRKIRCGDVIVFIPPGHNRKIVHRVVSVNSQGIETKGDNNNQVDSFILNQENIIGCVVYARRGNKGRKVFGGRRGQLFSIAVRVKKVLDIGISSVLRHPYYWMARTAILSRLAQRLIKPKVISFNRPKGTELQLLVKHHVIGRLLPGKKKWDIRRPFRLFIQEESLPQRESVINTLSD